jgi:hypothetical protein
MFKYMVILRFQVKIVVIKKDFYEKIIICFLFPAIFSGLF